MGSRTGTERFASATIAAVLALAPCVASAEPSDQDKAVAQALFDKARTLAEANKFEDACPLFEESERLDPGDGTKLNLALCYEGEKRYAKAYLLLNDSLSAAIRDGRTDRRAIAEEHLATIGPRLSMLTVEVPDDARVPELILWLDGEKISSASANVPIAVDGGSHEVEATARLHHPFSTRIDVKPEHDRVVVTVPKLAPFEPAPTPPEAPLSPPPIAPIAAVKAPPPKPPPPRRETRPIAWALGGIGLGLVVVGAITGPIALVRDGEAQDLSLGSGCNFDRGYCPKGAMPTAATSKLNEAYALGWTSTISLGVGVTSFIVALALPKRDVPASHGTPRASVGIGPNGVGVSGTF